MIHPELIDVAAYLCSQDYDDAARTRVLERLADGVSPRQCVLDGALDPWDLAGVEGYLPPARRPAGPDRELAAILADEPALAAVFEELARPIRGGAPEPSPAESGRYISAQACAALDVTDADAIAGDVPARLPWHDAIAEWRRAGRWPQPE